MHTDALTVGGIHRFSYMYIALPNIVNLIMYIDLRTYVISKRRLVMHTFLKHLSLYTGYANHCSYALLIRI